MYELKSPGSSVDEVEIPDPDPLATARYSCIYWISHLCDSIAEAAPGEPGHLDASHNFLEKKFFTGLRLLVYFTASQKASPP
jgi:hypothetical protein